MASKMTVVVLCPHGRRQTVKASPNTSILEILEETCRKQGIKPEDYDISHYNKPLDLSLSVRFANLPNNALLELRPITTIRQEGTVTVCLQLESGERVTENFSPSVLLWDIIEKCHKTQNESQAEMGQGEPICVYMRQQIVGEKLKQTTLRSLGLTKGKAIIRLMYRQPEAMDDQAHVSMPITKAVPFKDYVVPSTDHSFSKQLRLDNSFGSNRYDHSSNDDKIIQSNQEKGNNWQSSNESTTTQSRSLEPTITQSKSLEPTITQNKSFETNIEYYKPEVEDINANGSLMKNEYSQEQIKKEFGEIIYLGARNAVLFNLEDILEVKKADLPDEFFELNVDDVRYLMKELKNTRQNLENTPLMLKSQREARLMQQLRCYKQTVIRIYFPDKFVLQGTFIADETVQAIWDFVQTYLEEKDLNFYLYTTPPKTKLPLDTTLLQAQLVPAAVIYFGCDIRKNGYIHPHIKTKVSDPRAATLEAAQCRKQKIPVDQNIIQAESSETMEENVENTENVPVERQKYVPPPSDKKTPKWFQLGKK